MSRFMIKHILPGFTSQASFFLCQIKIVEVSYSFTYRSGLISDLNSTEFPRFLKINIISLLLSLLENASKVPQI